MLQIWGKNFQNWESNNIDPQKNSHQANLRLNWQSQVILNSKKKGKTWHNCDKSWHDRGTENINLQKKEIATQKFLTL